MTSARDECAHSIRSVTAIAARMPVARQDPTCGVRERRVDASRSTRNLGEATFACALHLNNSLPTPWVDLPKKVSKEGERTAMRAAFLLPVLCFFSSSALAMPPRPTNSEMVPEHEAPAQKKSVANKVEKHAPDARAHEKKSVAKKVEKKEEVFTPCEEVTCPSEFILKDDASTTTCPASTEEPEECIPICCDPRAKCSNAQCPAGTVMKENAVELLCEKAQCMLPETTEYDTNACCVPW